jgi:hypothetical protein
MLIKKGERSEAKGEDGLPTSQYGSGLQELESCLTSM